MMLTILTGGPGCSQHTRLLEQMHKLAGEKRPSLLLVPESGSHQAERRLLQVCGNRDSAFASVTTFSKLTEDVLEETGCRVTTLDPGGRVLTMHRALAGVQSSLQYYKRASRPQLVEKLVEAASELMACNITPEQLLAAESLSPKIRDLGIIYASYDALCKAGELDPSSRTLLAAERLAESELLQGKHLFVDGFEGFTARNLTLLESMIAQAETVTVALLLGSDETLYTEQKQTMERLRRIAKKRGMDFRVEECSKAESCHPAGLQGLADDLFDFRATPREDADGLHLYTLADPVSECELAAALLRQRALAGVRCRDMAVVCGDLESYGSALQAAFDKYDLPLYLSQKTDLLRTPALQAALGGLNALEDGLSCEAVLDWLRCGVGAFSRDELDRLENYCNLWNIRGGKWLVPFTAPTCGYDRPMEDEAERLNTLETLRQRVAALLQPLRDELAVCTCGSEYAAVLQKHLEQIALEPLLDNRCKALQQSGRGREAAETAQLYHILQSALEQFSVVMEAVSMDRREFFRLLQLTLRQYDVSAIPPSLDSVQAVTFERLSAQSVREMVIIGGREGLFPPEKASLSLLSESERVALEGVGIELTQSALERVWQQQCALCRTIAAATDNLTITVPRRLSGGEACLPAFAFSRLAALRQIEPRDGAGLLESLALTAPKPLFRLACSAAEDGGEGPAAAALAALSKNEEQKAYLNTLRHYAEAPRGPLGDLELVRRLYGGRISLSATRLEQVSSCRMRHFLQYGLRAKPQRPARFGAVEIGTFVHYVVEKTIPELCENETVKPSALAAKHINAYLEHHLPKGADSARWKALFHQAGLLACHVVENVWEEICSGDFRPVSFELDFSRKGDLPPLELREGTMTLTVGGKIDRVDGFVRGDTLYLKVVDYKTGKKEFRLSDLLYGLNLQMFLYLMMLQRAELPAVLKKFGVDAARIQPCGALYIPARAPFAAAEPGMSPEDIQKLMDKELRRIGLVPDDSDLLEAMENGGTFRFLPVGIKKDGGFTAGSCIASTAQLGRLLRKTEDNLRQIARLIAGGDIEASPYRVERDKTACQYCDFKEACHFDPTLKKDKLRFLPAESPARVYEILEEEQDGKEEQA